MTVWCGSVQGRVGHREDIVCECNSNATAEEFIRPVRFRLAEVKEREGPRWGQCCVVSFVGLAVSHIMVADALMRSLHAHALNTPYGNRRRIQY